MEKRDEARAVTEPGRTSPAPIGDMGGPRATNGGGTHGVDMSDSDYREYKSSKRKEVRSRPLTPPLTVSTASFTSHGDTPRHDDGASASSAMSDHGEDYTSSSSQSSLMPEETTRVPSPPPISTASTRQVPSQSDDGPLSNPPTQSQPPLAPLSKTTSREAQPPTSVKKLSALEIQDLTSAPDSLPVLSGSGGGRRWTGEHPASAGLPETNPRLLASGDFFYSATSSNSGTPTPSAPPNHSMSRGASSTGLYAGRGDVFQRRPMPSPRGLSTPPHTRRAEDAAAARRNSVNPLGRPPPPSLDLAGGASRRARTPSVEPADDGEITVGGEADGAVGSVGGTASGPPPIPLPPMSIPTHLQLELAAGRPSPLYIASMADPRDPYESAAVKFERLLNVLRLPFSLELAMGFGALACADAWLYTFTILPLRFVNAFAILAGWWLGVVAREARWVVGFVWYGVGRVRERWRSRTGEGAGVGVGGRNRSSSEAVSETSTDGGGGGVRTTMNGHGPSRAGSQQRAPLASKTAASGATGSSGGFRHRRTKSEPSKLSSFHKADLLQGGVLLFSCLALMRLDASRMYHVIRAQSAIKLYVIYNALEVGDRLLSALGQDVIECLLCSETLSRNASGRSKVLLPLGMFALALVYNIAHSVALFYQVITLNVAVNSYSNALLTLLMSNQFVEIKSTVFKRFEKENLFQLTCADIVERFQLCLMVFIIAMRNVVEVGYLFVPGSGIDMLGGAGAADDTTVSAFSSSGYANATASAVSGTSWWSGALHTAASLPHSFTALPSWLWSIDVLSPFVIVLGSEVIVDWIKHAYVTKFNNVRPTFYARIMDILCKDYYTNAFVTPTITRRLGLPLLPLSCLFIRACVQTYHMFLASYATVPTPPSTLTSLVVDAADSSGQSPSPPPSPAITATLEHLDQLIRGSLGRSIYGDPFAASSSDTSKRLAGGTGMAGPSLLYPWRWSADDAVAVATMLVVFTLLFLCFLALKLVLGIILLRVARDRYARVRAREIAVAQGRAEPEPRDIYDLKGSRRIGGYGKVEVGDDRRKMIYEDDVEGLRKAREKERKAMGIPHTEASGEGDGGGKGASGGGGGSGSGRGRGADKEIDWNTVMRYEMINKRIW